MENQERISGSQLLSITVCFAMGTILRSVIISSITAHDSWTAAFTGVLAYIPLLAVMLALANRYPGKSLFEINEKVFGPIIGRVVSCFYFYFFITTCVINVLDTGSLITGFILPGTPLLVIISVLMFSCCYAVRKGFGPLARISTLLALGSVITFTLNFLLSLTNANLSYLFPMFNLPPLNYFQAAHLAATVPFGENIVFMMLLPLLGMKTRPKKPFVANMIYIVIMGFIVHIREALTLGPLTSLVAHPSYEAMRLVRIGSVLTRIESIYAFIMITLAFFKICTLFYASSSGIAQITRMDSYMPIAFLLGIFITIYAVQVYSSPYDSLYWSSNVSPFVATLFEYILPSITLLIAWLKGNIRRVWNA